MTSTYRRLVRTPITKAVERVTLALRERGFEVSKPIVQGHQVEGSHGSISWGFSIVGVSGPGWAVMSAEGGEVSVWLNVIISEVDGRSVDIAIPPFPVGAAYIADDSRFRLFREALEAA